jgi:WD40 repeat protein
LNNAEELGVDGHRLLFEGLQRLRRCEPLRSEEHDTIGTALDSTGRYIVAGDVWRASVWDLSTRPARRLGAVDALHTDLPLLSPRGDRLLSGASNGAVLWDATTWQPIGSVEADREASSSAAFSPDGHWLAVAAGEHVWLLAAEDGRLVQEFDHGRTIGIDDLRFDPVGTTLLACSSERLRLWDVVDGRLRYSVAAGTRSALWSARFSADGSWIVAARGNRRISIWRTEDGELSQTIVGKQGDEFRDAWFADGDRIILAFDGLYLRSWDWPGGRGHGREVGHDALFALAPIGRKVALSNGDRSGKIELRDIRTGELIETLGRHEDSVTALAWTDSGEHLVSGDKNGMLVQWAMSTLSVHAVLETHGGAIGHIRALPEAAGVAATCRDGAVRVWRFDASLALRRLEDVMRSVCVSPAAQLAVAVAHDEGVATLFDGGFNQARSRFLPVEDTRACAFSPDGRWLATIGGDAMVYLINPTTLKTVCSWQGPEGAYCLTWDTAGRRLLVAGPRFCVVWNNQRQAPELFLGSDQLYVYKAALSADGRRVCVAEEYIEITGVVHKAVGYGVRIVDIDSGLGVAHLTWGDDPIERRCSCLSFAPDDSKVLVAWVTDGSVWLVDAASGAMIRSFGDEESRKNFADWAPDGRAVITADRNSVEVWNAADGGLIARLDAQASVRAVVFSPNGKLAATVGSHAVWVWECTTWTPLANLFDGVDRFPASAAFNASGDGLIVIEADGQAACYPVSREALCDAARPWLTAVRAQ